MAISEKSRARLQALDDRLVRLRANRERLVAQVSVAERRRETRRKIVIGGTVLAATEHEGVPPLRDRDELHRWLDQKLQRPQDRSVFELADAGPAADAKQR
jgi:hypothetical protein